MLRIQKLRNGLVAVVAAAAMSFGMMQTASAELYGSAVLNIYDIVYYWDDNNDGALDGGDDVIDISDFTALSVSNSGRATADLTSTGGDGDSGLIISGGDVIIPRACDPDCTSAPAEDSTTVISSQPAAHFASADATFINSPISGVGAPLGSQSLTRADISLIGADTGDGHSNTGTTTGFNFTLVAGGHTGDEILITFSFDANADTAITSPVDPGNTVTADMDFTISIIDTNGVSILSGSLSDFSTCSAAASNDFVNPDSCTDSGSYAFSTLGFKMGSSYRLTIRQNADVVAVLVPEPGTLAIMGSGLLGLMALRRRNRRKASVKKAA